MKTDAIETAILQLLAARGPDKTVCPSEVARALQSDWRPLMPRVRAEAVRLAAESRIAITQAGQVVDPSSLRGPIRLRSKTNPAHQPHHTENASDL